MNIMHKTYYATLPNGEIVKLEFCYDSNTDFIEMTVDRGAYVDTDSVRGMTTDVWHLLRNIMFRKLMQE